jgi:hypothetical protein
VKKFLSIILLLIYTATSSGTVMSAHFCMGELAGISIGEKEQEACGYCGMEDAGCCHDLLQVVKLDNSQLEKTSNFSVENNLSLKVEIPTLQFKENLFRNSTGLYVISSIKLGGPPNYLRNCVFRI